MNPATAALTIFLMAMNVTLNPDGSGKAVIEFTLSPPSSRQAVAGQKAAPSPEEIKDFSRHAFMLTQGVDTWSDVSIGTTAEGLLHFKGTGYFTDLGKLKINGSRGDLPLTWTKDPRGGMVLAVHWDANPSRPAPVPPPKMTEEELAKAVEAVRAEWKQLAPRLEQRQNFGKYRHTYSFKLPGPAEEVSGFKKEADGSLLFEFDMERIVKAVGDLVADETYLRSCIKAGVKPGEDTRDPLFMEKAFGSKGPFTARVTGEMKPQFDYTAEVKAAQQAALKGEKKLPDQAAEPANPPKPK